MEAKLGGFVWVADVLESMSERERVAKEVALEAEQRKLQESMEMDEDIAQTQAEADAAAGQFQWKNPDFILKNPDFLLKNPDFLLNDADFIIKQRRRRPWRR